MEKSSWPVPNGKVQLDSKKEKKKKKRGPNRRSWWVVGWFDRGCGKQEVGLFCFNLEDGGGRVVGDKRATKAVQRKKR